MGEERVALLDTDFIVNISGIECDQDQKGEILRELLGAVKVIGCVHPLVKKYEWDKWAKSVPFIPLVMEKGLVICRALQDFFLGDREKEVYYKYLVKELANKFSSISLSDADVFSYWESNKCLGEIHSMSLCLVCGCLMFLSDDGDCDLINSFLSKIEMGSGTVSVYSRKSLVDKCEKDNVLLFGGDVMLINKFVRAHYQGGEN